MSFIIQTTDTSKVLAALQAMLKNAPSLQVFGAKITRGEPVNVDPNLTPWMGIYRYNGKFPSRTLGVGNGFREQRQGIAIVIQNASQIGAECQDALGAWTKAVCDCILTDTSIGGTMDVVDDFNVNDTSPASQGGTSSFQSVIVTFTALKQVGVSGG